MEHTYLFAEGVWEIGGSYFDERGKPIPVWGRTTVEHRTDRWFVRGVTKLLYSPPIEYQNNYELDPWKQGEETTAWRSFNPATGTFLGVFMRVADSILSSFTSEKDEYSGYEYFLQIDENTYRNRGFSFRRGDKLSSWAVDYRRAVP